MQLKQGKVLTELNSESLQDSIRRAIAKAEDLGSAVLLSYSQDWQCHDPLAFLADKSSPTQHQFYWKQANLVLAAAGVAAIVPDRDPNFDRFEIAKQFTRSYLLDAIVAGETKLGKLSPYALGGFAFHDLHPSPKLWYGFPRSMMFVPEWILQQHGQHQNLCCTLTVNHCVLPQDDLATITQLINRKFADLSVDRINPLNPISPNSIEISETSAGRKHSWEEMVAQAIDLIHQGKLEKIVLSRALDIVAQQDFNPFVVLAALQQSYPECVSFMVSCGDAVFLGATPELLLQFQGDLFQEANRRLSIRSNALAGSTGRGISLSEDRLMGDRLLNSKKDRLEHQIVVRSICDRLSNLGASISELPPPRLLKLFNVQHLHTPIIATLPNTHWLSAFDVLQQLHPTAAVGGEPSELALELLQKWESCDRGWYAAPIGWVNGNGTGAFAVGIRSGYLKGNKARIYAGAGIVTDSQVEAELKETNIKFAALLKALSTEN